MGNVKLENNVMQVVGMLEEEVIAFLYEAGGELLSQVARNTKVNEGQLKGSWQLVVDENKLEAIVGSPLENAIWEEFGTGEFALNGDGRNGGWWIKVGSGQNEISPNVVARYHWEKVSKDENGNINFVFTRGKKPKRALTQAFEQTKPRIQRRLQQLMGG